MREIAETEEMPKWDDVKIIREIIRVCRVCTTVEVL